MSTTDNFLSEYEQHEKLLKDANAKNKDVVFTALSALSITRVTVTFDGEGDSGQIEDVVYYRGESPCQAPKVSVAFRDVSWRDTRPLEKPLNAAIESLCYDYLSQEHGGWENDDGAYGEFTFSVAEQRIELDFSARYTDTNTYSHTF
jgi:hypothetical protein